MTEATVSNIANLIRYDLKHSRLDPTNVLAIIKYAYELTASFQNNRTEIVIAIIEEVAKGADGIAGTDDDILSPSTVETIKEMINSKIAHQFVDILHDIHLEIGAYANTGCCISSCLK